MDIKLKIITLLSQLNYLDRRKIVIFHLLFLTLLYVVTYTITYRLISSYYYKESNNQILSSVKFPFESLATDIEKCFMLLGIIAKEQDKQNYAYLSDKMEREALMIMRRFKIEISDQYQDEDDIISYQDYFKVFILKKNIDGRISILLKASYMDMVDEINTRIHNNNVKYALYNNANKLVLSNTDEQMPSLKTLSATRSFKKLGLKLTTWLDAEFLNNQKQKAQKISLVIASILVSIIYITYVFTKYIYRNIIFAKYVKKLNLLKQENSKLNIVNDRLKKLKDDSEIKRYFEDIMVAELKMKLSNVYNRIAEQVSILQSQYCEDFITEELKKVGRYVVDVCSLKLISDAPEVVNIRLLLDNSISYWREEIHRKEIKISLKCSVENEHIAISYISFYQILCSVIGAIILSLPKKRGLSLSIEKDSDSNIELSFKDNGFGISLDCLPKYKSKFETDRMFILSWLQVTQVLEKLNLDYFMSSNTDKGNELKIIFPLYVPMKESNTVEESNVINISKYRK